MHVILPTSVSQEQPKKPRKLLDQLRDAIRIRHYSFKTEKTYVFWAKRFIFFHNVRHPKEIVPSGEERRKVSSYDSETDPDRLRQKGSQVEGLISREILPIVYFYSILSTMSGQNRNKLNQLLGNWPKGTVAVHAWLQDQGIYRQLAKR